MGRFGLLIVILIVVAVYEDSKNEKTINYKIEFDTNLNHFRFFEPLI